MSTSCVLTVLTADDMVRVGRWLGENLRPADVVVLNGDLGAGKTTLTQGLGAGLGVSEPITSPTFVIAREHKIPVGSFVHIDAYRLGSAAELDDLGIDWESAISVIEWGAGVVEGFDFTPLVLDISADDADVRTIYAHAQGSRWSDLLDELGSSPWASS